MTRLRRSDDGLGAARGCLVALVATFVVELAIVLPIAWFLLR